MKEFFKKYSYTMVKLFLNQIAIALFGVALSFACAYAGNDTLVWVVGIFTVLFYLFLQYAVMWEVGAKDGITATARKTGRKLWRGPVIALFGNSVNLLLALMILPGAFAKVGGGLYSFSAICKSVALMVEGMYMGILSVPFGGAQLHDFVWPYFVILLPALLVCSVAYILGSYNIHATNILIQKNKDVKNNGRPE